MKRVLICVLLALPLVVHQSLSAEETEERAKVNFPETDIFLFDLDLGNTEKPLRNGHNVTARPGYDNQPYFTPGSESFLYSRSDDFQTDIYEYKISSATAIRLTESEATEFSPTPKSDNSAISFVTDRSDSLWIADRSNLNNPRWAQTHNNNREPIGYYAWNHETGDILYWSQYGFSVTLVHESTQNHHFVSGHAVPSTPHIIPGTNNFSFVHRQSNGQVWIKEFNPKTKAIRPLTPIVGSNANYCWTPDGAILMIENDVLYRWAADDKQAWQPLAKLAEFGVRNTNRVAISPNGKHLAVVGLPAE